MRRPAREYAAARLEARRASVPVVRYDGTLPVHAKRAEIAAVIARSPVTIVSGATGSDLPAWLTARAPGARWKESGRSSSWGC